MGTRIRLGIALRSMGPQSRPSTFVACAHRAEDAGLDDVWVQDHLAIPPDDAQGSGGRYLDPLSSLAFLAAATSRIGLGTGVLNLPYRAALPTAKTIATVQELSAGRLLLGVGLGWMEAEFRALAIPRAQRGKRCDETLEFLHRCFAADLVEANGQEFLFLPRPQRPPIYIGGSAPHALSRAVRWGDGWMPMPMEPLQLAIAIRELRERFAAAGRDEPQIVVLSGFKGKEPAAAADRARALADAGATHIVFTERYDDESDFARAVDFAQSVLRPALDSVHL